MQLVYGNDGQNYITITKSAGITDVQEARLLEDYRGYGYVKNREAYSDPSKEPVSLTYVTTDLLESNRKNVLLVKNARMRSIGIMTAVVPPSTRKPTFVSPPARHTASCVFT